MNPFDETAVQQILPASLGSPQKKEKEHEAHIQEIIPIFQNFKVRFNSIRVNERTWIQVKPFNLTGHDTWSYRKRGQDHRPRILGGQFEAWSAVK